MQTVRRTTLTRTIGRFKKNSIRHYSTLMALLAREKFTRGENWFASDYNTRAMLRHFRNCIAIPWRSEKIKLDRTACREYSHGPRKWKMRVQAIFCGSAAPIVS